MSADDAIRDILQRHGAKMETGTVWRVQGTPVILHKALERIAAKADIVFERPTIIRAERDEAVILVVGKIGDNEDFREEWSIGEALIGANYRVSGKQAAYVYAMAEKRAKDRVILKLIGLHGLAYSEEEADEFKAAASAAAQPTVETPKRETADPEPRPAGRPASGTREWREALFKHARARASLGNDALNEWWSKQSGEAQAALETINAELDAIVDEAAGRREAAE